jgi:hypothetical protein
MSEMVDRVAEAIMRRRFPEAPVTFAAVVEAVRLGSDPTLETTLGDLRADASAAIRAMMEPTEEMRRSGERTWMDRDLSDPKSDSIRDAYRAMILAAFVEEKP